MMMSTPPINTGAGPEASHKNPEAATLREITPTQWRSGIAAWLGWLFDGLDMHLYTLVAAVFVMQLLNAPGPADPEVKAKSSWIQAAFLAGWALGGAFFGRLGDILGRSRALSLTILTYAGFTGLSFFAHTWWQLLICRFVAALGIGGEWGVGASLLSETWPRAWRPWLAAILQTGVNLGILGACVTVYSLAWICGELGLPYRPKWVFLVGILPALLVFYIRRGVPETPEWEQEQKKARASGKNDRPSIGALFSREARPLTLKIILICALSLTAWWAYMFWHPQHLRNHPDLANWAVSKREKLVTTAFFLVIGISIFGNFFAAWVAKRWGYRAAFGGMFLAAFLFMMGAFAVPHSATALAYFWFPAVGFFSGVFGLFTMYLPPLFPTLLRTTGSGFCYNIGRLFAALGTVVFGLFSKVGDFRTALLMVGSLFLLAALAAIPLPEPSAKDA